MEISKHRMEINWVGGCAWLCKIGDGGSPWCHRLLWHHCSTCDVIWVVLALMGGDYDIIDCYDITEVPMMSFVWLWLWLWYHRLLWHHWSSYDVICEVLALMGGDYDIIDCYDITEVPMMSFVWLWLWLWYHRLLWHHWCSYDVICEALALMEVILISWRGEWVQLQ